MFHMIYAVALASLKHAYISLVELNRGLMLIPVIAICWKAFGIPGLVISIVQAFIVNGIYAYVSIRSLKKLSKGE